MGKNIITEVTDKVATIFLNRPQVHNALNPEIIQELTLAMEELSKLDSLNVIVIKGKGDSFCSGADISWFREMSQGDKQETKKAVKHLPELLLAIYNSPKITIAVVHGSVLGGGIGLAVACDFVVSEQTCKFAFSEVKLGIAPATIAPFVIIKMDSIKAKGLMFTGENFDGIMAEKIGMVSHLAANGKLSQELEKLLYKLKGSSVNSVRQIKKMMNQTRHQQLILKELEGATGVLAELIHSEEAQKMMKHFFEERESAAN